MLYGMQFDFLKKLAGWDGSNIRLQLFPKLQAVSKPEETALTARARELLRSLGYDKLAERVNVHWNARMRTTAGLAGYARSTVTLNPKLAQFGEAEIDKTLRHELGHLLAQHRAGRRRIAPHGAEWKQACRDLGLPDEKRCHELPLPRTKMRPRHTYRCPACKTDIKRVRPFHGRVACLACCQEHNNGHYHEKFRLIKLTASGE